jgi:hypothetical protein
MRRSSWAILFLRWFLVSSLLWSLELQLPGILRIWAGGITGFDMISFS